MNLDEKMILLATAFLFLPYQIASVAVACVLEVSQKIHLKRCVILLLFYRYLRLSTVCISLIRFPLRMDEHF